MTTASTPLVRWGRPARGGTPLVCFPWAGGGAATYRHWSVRLPQQVEVWAARLPGRENRLREPPSADLDRLVGEFAEVIERELDRDPVLFGHGTGALLAYELALELRRRGRRPARHLVVAAQAAPSTPVPRGPFRDLRDELRKLGFAEEAILSDPEMLELLRPALEADIQMAATCRPRPERSLDVPVTAFAGRQDPIMSRAAMLAWGRETTDAFQLVELAGGHLFDGATGDGLIDAVGEVVLRHARSMDGSSAGPVTVQPVRGSRVDLAEDRAATETDPTCLVGVHNEWDPLEEVIIGTAVGARVPVAGRDLAAIEFADCAGKVPSGPFPGWVIEETEAELARLCTELTRLGVTVRRPEPRLHAANVATPDWQSDGFYDYCPRDVLLTVGRTVIETPMVLRSRFLEPFAYRGLLLEYFRSGARWISAPKPRLRDEMYDVDAPAGKRLGDIEPAFDAANVLRFGTDLLYLVSDTGNELGWRWLEAVLGPAYTLHPARGLYAHTHVDSTIVPLQPGLVLLNPERVNQDNLPGFLRGWDKLYAPDLVATPWVGERPHCSKWIGMNLLVVRPGLVIADDRQPALIKLLEGSKVEVLPLRLTHARTLGGGFHCVSLDVRRRGQLATYR